MYIPSALMYTGDHAKHCYVEQIKLATHQFNLFHSQVYYEIRKIFNAQNHQENCTEFTPNPLHLDSQAIKSCIIRVFIEEMNKN